MINKFTVAKVFNDKALAASGAVRFVSMIEEYSPEIDTPYIKESLLYGSDESLGTASSDSDIARGVYTLTVYTPKINKGAKWQCLALIDELNASMPKFTQLNESPSIMLREAITGPTTTGETHISCDLDIRFTVIG